MPAGLYHTVLASSAIAAPPANALPIPEALFSASWKNAAEAGAEIPAMATARLTQKKAGTRLHVFILPCGERRCHLRQTFYARRGDSFPPTQ
jgi:hypothetical protein